MKISGSSKLSAGNIDDTIIVSGLARINGDFSCDAFRSSGSLKSEGNLVVRGDVKSSGSFRILGALHGDGNAKFSGSASIGEEIDLKGELENSGSLRAGGNIDAIGGMRFSGSSKIDGGLTSEETIEIEGSTTVRGGIKAKNVLIGSQSSFGGKRVSKHPYKVFGDIFATKDIEIINTFVQGDVRGRNVKIGKRSEILGKVYYIDTIEIDKKAILTHEPLQISEIAENELQK